MHTYEAKLNENPIHAKTKIIQNQDANLFFEEIKEIEGKTIITLLFEKYYIRVGSNGTLAVLIDNIKGYTTVKAVACTIMRDPITKGLSLNNI